MNFKKLIFPVVIISLFIFNPKEDQYIEFLKFIGLTDKEIEEYANGVNEDEQ